MSNGEECARCWFAAEGGGIRAAYGPCVVSKRWRRDCEGRAATIYRAQRRVCRSVPVQRKPVRPGIESGDASARCDADSGRKGERHVRA